MLQIRLNRVGKKNKAYFRVVLQEHTVAPGGRHVEILGSWDPHRKSGVFNGEKINYWIGKGAQVSDSVWNILIKQGIVKGKKRAIKISPAKSAEADHGAGKKAEKPEKEEKPAGAEVKPEAKEIKKEKIEKEESKKEEIKAEETKAEPKKEEKTEEKKPEKAKPEERK